MVKAKIKKAYLDKELDTVVWQVELADGKKADIVWPRDEFGSTFNIAGEIPEPMIIEFCNMMIGKEVNVSIGG
jgi:hypothetical protein